jgi:hypothetical protein
MAALLQRERRGRSNVHLVTVDIQFPAITTRAKKKARPAPRASLLESL